MTVLGGICEIVGVVLFMVGFFYCAKEALVWSYQSYQRKKQQKQREKKDSNCAIKRVEVLPVDAKPKQLQRQKSETTNPERASTVGRSCGIAKVHQVHL